MRRAWESTECERSRSTEVAVSTGWAKVSTERGSVQCTERGWAQSTNDMMSMEFRSQAEHGRSSSAQGVPSGGVGSRVVTVHVALALVRG